MRRNMAVLSVFVLCFLSFPSLATELQAKETKARVFLDLSGEWIFPCQNLGTDGLVFSRERRLAYIGNQAVFVVIDFSGPNCECPSREGDHRWFEIDMSLWSFEIKRESPFAPGAYEIDYTPNQSAEDEGTTVVYRELVGKEGRKLYVSLQKRPLNSRSFKLESEPFIFFGPVTESVEAYMDRQTCRKFNDLISNTPPG